jgi:acetoacetyl-CoA synthetase
MEFCAARVGREFADSTDFYDFSITEMPKFWQLFLDWSDLLWEGSPQPVCTDATSCADAAFYPNLRLNYVENLLRCDSIDEAPLPAVIAHHASRPPDRLSRGQLRLRVVRVAGQLRALNVGPEDRVVAVVRNNAEAIVAGLAAAAIGATFSSVSPEMGAVTILDRFEQLEPRVLFANLASNSDPASTLLADRVGEVARGLPTLTTLIAVDDGPAPSDLHLPLLRLTDLVAESNATRLIEFERLPFNHPLFVLFSSGTTGRPKCILHGAGGTLIEHLKEHRLHCDLQSGDVLFFQTSAAWMMWNWQLSALASKAAIVTYDGPVGDADTLWRIVEAERVTVFGTSPPYLRLCADNGYSPREQRDLTALRSVLSTGSILHAEQYDWVRDHVGDLPLQSISGGTDIIGCFALGHPNLPVHRGMIQTRSLGLDVRALSPDTAPATTNHGELICTNPFPSRPLGLVGDDGTRLHDAYYRDNKNMWTHGDLIEIDDAGQVRMHGRSDGVLNIRGIRIGPAEIYRVLHDVGEITEAIAVEQQTPGGLESSRLVLAVVLRHHAVLDGALVSRIRQALATEASPAHVPRVIVAVDELPSTHSGKRSERAMRDALNGVSITNLQALANPDSLTRIVAAVRAADAELRARLDAPLDSSDEPIRDRLRSIWEHVLGIAPIALDDDFFEVGGTSLDAARLLNAIRLDLGTDLPLSTLLEARTIHTMADVIATERDGVFPLHVALKSGGDSRPVFIVHGLYGDILDLRALALNITTDQAIYGLRSRGLDGRTAPQRSIEAMAAEFVETVRRIQPVGPYALAGHSFGGLIAFEMARLLTRSGERVGPLLIIDSYVEDGWWWLRKIKLAARYPSRAFGWLRRLVAASAASRFGPSQPVPPEHVLPQLGAKIGAINLRAFRRYRPTPYPGRATFIRANLRDPRWCDPLPVWVRVVEGGLDVTSLDCDHDDLLLEPHLSAIAARLTSDLHAPSARVNAS